jgi:putative restriction endonuclease
VSGPTFGHTLGCPVGSHFENRAGLAEAGVHWHRQAGISGTADKGADSIVLSGGYEDDQDHGDVIVYTGYGGRDQNTKKQVADQPFTVWNRALAYSSLNGLPVRVIRGDRHDSPYSPKSGYVYAGLYSVDDYWHEIGKSGFRIWRYRLTKLPNQEYEPEGASAEPSIDEAPDPKGPAPRRLGQVLRIVRDTQQARRIKQLHDYRCQMCGTRLEGAAGPYAEAGHIRPLGAPHNGPDTADPLQADPIGPGQRHVSRTSRRGGLFGRSKKLGGMDFLAPTPHFPR